MAKRKSEARPAQNAKSSRQACQVQTARSSAEPSQRQMGLRLRRRPRRGQGRHARSARRQGRGACRNGQSRPAGAARLHHHHRGLHLFTTPTSKHYPKDLQAQVDKALAQVGKITGKTFGDKANPLLVSVRSGARASMPGMMDTVLNLGLNDETVEALAKKSGDRRFAYDSYRALHHHVFRRGARRRPRAFRGIARPPQGAAGLQLDTDLDRRRLGRAGRALQEAAAGASAASRSRRIRTSNCGARSAPCSAPG